MRTLRLAAIVAAAVLASACGKTEEGDLTVERPADIDVRSTTDTIKTPNMPDVDVGTTKDTLVVNRPTVTVKPDTSK
jgi:hypothetical protein